jgi:hypothetical protein
MHDETRDWVGEAVAQAPQWEPPPGFALRVTAAARQRYTPTEPRAQRERLFLASWWRLSLIDAVTARMQNTMWVLRQYRSLVTDR